MTLVSHLPHVTVYPNRICDNVARFNGLITSAMPEQWPATTPVIKADAYGHGLIPVGKALCRSGSEMLSAGSVEECVMLREALAEAGHNPRLIALLGVVTPEDIEAAAKHRIIGLVHCFDQLDMYEASAKAPVEIALKFNLGMARLGFLEEDLPELMQRLLKTPWLKPVVAASHLPKGDDASALSEIKTQADALARIMTGLRTNWPDMVPSLANSPGMLAADKLLSEALGPHIRRLGVAIYGINPLASANHGPAGLAFSPAMEVTAPVLAIRTLKRGQGIGYSHLYKAKEDMRVAIIGVGYADGYSRGLTGKAQVCLHGERAPLVGRISMQMSAVAIPHRLDVKTGDRAWLLGGDFTNAISATELANMWGTIPYEVVCLLGCNARTYKE